MTSHIDARRKHAQNEPSPEYLSKRKVIVDAAARVFQRSGYERASINDVAIEAGADRASVYYYFKGKHEIFHAVIIEAVQKLTGAAEAIAASQDGPSEKVRALVNEVMRAYSDHYPYLHVYVQEDMNRLDSETVSAKTLRQLARRFTESFEQVITAGVQSGDFTSDMSPRLMTYSILGSLNWTHRWYVPGRAESAEDVATAFADVFLRGVVAAR
jgi:AcrR family transcriptional regulator